MYDDYQLSEWHYRSGHGFTTKFRPNKLPPAKAFPELAVLFDPTKSDVTPPAQRVLSAVGHHHHWLALVEARREIDKTRGVHVHGTEAKVPHREERRFIANSQPGASGWLTLRNDGSYATRFESDLFTNALQRRGGLHISCALGAIGVLRARGESVDPRFDTETNEVQHTTRHNGVMRCVREALSAVSLGPVMEGDKMPDDTAASYNVGHTVDLVEVEGDDATGGDVEHEIKCPSALRASIPAGGHSQPFGTTAENFYKIVYGIRARGHRSDPRYDYKTGRGRLDRVVGDYDDALRKGYKVVLWLVESSGGIERGALRHLNLIAKRITGNKGSDRTKYGTHPLAPKSFVPHHMQRLSVAAVKGDAKGVRAAANSLKRKVMGNAASAAAVGARA